MLDKIKRILVIVMCVCMAVTFAGCGEDSSQGDAASPSLKSGEYLLYYVNSDFTGYIPKKIKLDKMSSTENVIDMIMADLMEGDGSDSVMPVPHGMTYQRYTFDGEGTLNLIFSVDWEMTNSYSMVLSKAAFVKTLCQVDSVDTVIFEMVDLVNESNVVKEKLTEDSFADMNDIMNSEIETKIYMPDSTGQHLVERTVMLDYSSAETLEEQVLACLKTNYDGTVIPFNSKTVVKSVETVDGECIVTFNEAFVQGTDGVDDEVLIYSIVDSLVRLESVGSVKIVAANTNDRLNNIDLSKDFTVNYSYVQAD